MFGKSYLFIFKQNQSLFYKGWLSFLLSLEYLFTYNELCALGKSLCLSHNALVIPFPQTSVGHTVTFKIFHWARAYTQNKRKDAL